MQCKKRHTAGIYAPARNKEVIHTNKITRTLLGTILVIASISGCHAATFAGDVITFTDPPTAIAIEAGSQASFDVTLRNLGDLYADVSITAELPDGISIVSGDEARLVDMRKSVDYHIVIAAGEDMASGTYPLEIADKSDVDQHTWHTIDLHVTGRSVATPAATIEPVNEEEPEEEEKKSPGFGFTAVAVAFGLLMAMAYHSRFR